MYWTLRKGNREVRVHSWLKMIWLRFLGWKVKYRFEVKIQCFTKQKNG